MSQPLLVAKDLHKQFTHPVAVDILNGISLAVDQGETIAITGPSGEGKSTLLYILGTLENATKGSLVIKGEEVSSFNKPRIRNEHLAFVFQSFHLLEDYTALENVLMPARIARKSCTQHSPAYLRGCQLLEQVGLTDRAHFRVKQLSGGEKQRVAIARAFCNDPSLILADEPSGNLDHDNSTNVHELLINFAKQGNKGLIVVTHDPALGSLCDKQYTLQKGQLTPI